MQQAIDFEVQWQIDRLEDGLAVEQATVLFDADSGQTRAMRSKEDAHDYRYFPDPDLPPLVIEQAWVDSLKAALPELPDARRARYVAMGLTPYDAHVLTLEKETAAFFETVARGRDAKVASNWVTGDFFAALNRLKRDITDPPVTAENMGALMDLLADNTLSGKLAKEVFEAMIETGKSPGDIVNERGLKQVTDTGAIEAVVDDVLAKNADKVAEFRSGKDKLFGFFVGQTMKAMQGKGNPALVNEIVKKKLG